MEEGGIYSVRIVIVENPKSIDPSLNPMRVKMTTLPYIDHNGVVGGQ